VASIYVPQLKKKTAATGCALIFTDEASFRQDSTLHATWSRIGTPPVVPVTGQRKSAKIFGAVELYSARFLYQSETVFNADTYLAFMRNTVAPRYRRRGAILIQDNASYHKDADVWAWFAANRRWLEVHQLPPYSPEFNPVERIWQYTRKNGTHNRYFATLDEVFATLHRVFGDIQAKPELIQPHLSYFC
jgi:transposase